MIDWNGLRAVHIKQQCDYGHAGAVPAQKEIIVATRGSEVRADEVKARAEASFKKEERAKEGARAMMEYQANGKAAREKMAQLKALRLAKEAADKEAERPKAPARKR
jgi:hypothetical protein